MEFETKNGHLMWDGCDTVALAEKFGTPLYGFCQQSFLNACDAKNY